MPSGPEVQLNYATMPSPWYRRKQVRIVAVCTAGVVTSLLAASYLSRRSSLELLLSQPGHGEVYNFFGHTTQYVHNPVFDAVVASSDAKVTSKLVISLQSGQLKSGPFCVVDLALWRRVTGLRKEDIAVLGSYQRPVDPADYTAIAASWAAWLKAGRPTLQRSGRPIPDLRGYPHLDQVIHNVSEEEGTDTGVDRARTSPSRP